MMSDEKVLLGYKMGITRVISTPSTILTSKWLKINNIQLSVQLIQGFRFMFTLILASISLNETLWKKLKSNVIFFYNCNKINKKNFCEYAVT